MARRISPGDFRATLGTFATGVTVVGTRVDDLLHGMTANAFSSVSLDPPLVLVCVDVASVCHDLLVEAGAFAATVLAADQERESVWFATTARPSGREQFEGVEWRPAPVTGSPVIAGGVSWVDCRVSAVHPGGDHAIFVGEVVDLGVERDAEPLLFYRGAYRHLIDPGADPAPSMPDLGVDPI